MADTTALTEQLLADIRPYLGITWIDPETDKNLTGMIRRGMARLQKIAGVPLVFTEEDLPRSLLFDYCRYANSHALEMFEINFAGELVSLHINGQVQAASAITSSEVTT